MCKFSFDYSEYKSLSKKPKGNILFLSGFAFDCKLVKTYRQYINEYNCFNLNVIGVGKNNLPFNKKLIKQHCKIKNQGKYIAEFIRNKKLNNVIIIAHSLGCVYAAEAATHVPERIKYLIFENPITHFAYRYWFYFYFNMLPTSIDERIKLLKWQTVNYKELAKSQHAINTWSYYVNFIKDNYKTMNYWWKKIVYSPSEMLHSRRIYLNVNHPTIVLLGDKDLITPCKSATKFFKKNKNIKVHIIKNSMHISHVENLKQTKKIIDKFIN